MRFLTSLLLCVVARGETFLQKPKSVLDLGFLPLQKQLAEESTSPLIDWDKAPKGLRQAVIDAISTRLMTDLKPLKKSIGQSWVDLPKKKRDGFAQKLKEHIHGLFVDQTKTLKDRLDRRVGLWKQYPPKNLAVKDIFDLYESQLKRFEGRLKDYYELEAHTAPLLSQMRVLTSLIEVE